MLSAMGVHVERLSWGMHVDAPGICGAPFPSPTGTRVCTRAHSHPGPPGLRAER